MAQKGLWNLAREKCSSRGALSKEEGDVTTECIRRCMKRISCAVG